MAQPLLSTSQGTLAAPDLSTRQTERPNRALAGNASKRDSDSPTPVRSATDDHQPRLTRPDASPRILGGGLNLDINTGRQRELVQSINRLTCWLNNINDSLVSSNFELLARFFIHVRTPQNRVPLNTSRQRNWSMNDRAGPFRRIDDF